MIKLFISYDHFRVGCFKLLESVQRSWTHHIEGMSDLPYAVRLQVLDLYSVQGRLVRADLNTGKYFMGSVVSVLVIFS